MGKSWRYIGTLYFTRCWRALNLTLNHCVRKSNLQFKEDLHMNKLIPLGAVSRQTKFGGYNPLLVPDGAVVVAVTDTQYNSKLGHACATTPTESGVVICDNP